MCQSELAEAFHIPVGTLRDWEQHRCEPDQVVSADLTVIAAAPDVVHDALVRKLSREAKAKRPRK